VVASAPQHCEPDIYPVRPSAVRRTPDGLISSAGGPSRRPQPKFKDLKILAGIEKFHGIDAVLIFPALPEGIV
jgi:hypothetical protein